MGAMSNNSRKLANFAGFYKGIQSAGAAIAASIDSREPTFMAEFGTNWGLLAGSLVIAAPIIYRYVKDTVPVEEDLKFTDEHLVDVAPPQVVAEIKREETGVYSASHETAR